MCIFYSTSHLLSFSDMSHHMNTISILCFLYYVTIELLPYICCSRPRPSPSVSLILNPHESKRYHVFTTLLCPKMIASSELTSKSRGRHVKFTCHLAEKSENNGDTTKNNTVIAPEKYRIYHVTLFMVLGATDLDRCLYSSLDRCFSVNMHQVSVETISVRVASLSPCYVGRITFRYELRLSKHLISQGDMVVHFEHRLEVPAKMNAITTKMNRNKTQISLEGSVKSPCHYNLDELYYTMAYRLIGDKQCAAKNTSKCVLRKQGETTYTISCPIYLPCKDRSLVCSTIVKASIERNHTLGNLQSRLFTKSLAFVTSRGVLLNVTEFSLNSITVSFTKPVACVKAHHHYHYKVKYKSLNTVENTDWISRIRNSQVCSLKTNLDCEVHITGLEMNSNYTICIAFRNIFDIDAQYNESLCLNASTAQLPCRPPTVRKIIPGKVNATHWEASFHWFPIKESCWNDEDYEDYSVNHHRYLVEISDNNSTTPSSYTIPSVIGNLSSDQKVILLEYKRSYILTMSACNIFGCMNGHKTHFSVREGSGQVDHSLQKRAKNGKVGAKQRLTETVLICVLSFLFLAASCVLCFMLKRRKQFQRFEKMTGRHNYLTSSDIKFVRRDHEGLLITDPSSNEKTTTTSTAKKGISKDILKREIGGVVIQDNNKDVLDNIDYCIDETRVVKVDTRQLIYQKLTISDHRGRIPVNSSLV